MIPQQGRENMKRIALVVLCLAVLAAAVPAAQTTIVLKVKVQTANIRAEADASGAVLKQVALGTLLEARQKIGDWYEISMTNETGARITAYVSVTVVDVLSAAGQTPPPVAAPTAAPVSAPQPSYAPAPQPSYGSAPSTGGIKLIVGFGLANMSFTDSSTTNASQYDQYKKARGGFAVGLGFETGGTIGFELDLLYLQKGVRYQGSMAVTGGTDVFDFTAKLDEVSVPILLKFHILNMATGPDVYLAGGGEIAYVMSPKIVYTASGPDAGPSPQSGTQDEKDYVQSIDYGLVLGGGISLPLGGVKLCIEGRYHLGFANMEKVPAGDTESGTKPKTNALLILAGFKF
jgi:hypothetical protein